MVNLLVRAWLGGIQRCGDSRQWRWFGLPFLGYFGWVAIDSIPAVKVWDSFGVEQSIEPRNILAGSVIFIFRLTILIPGLYVVTALLLRQIRRQLRLITSDRIRDRAPASVNSNQSWTSAYCRIIFETLVTS